MSAPGYMVSLKVYEVGDAGGADHEIASDTFSVKTREEAMETFSAMMAAAGLTGGVASDIEEES